MKILNTKAENKDKHIIWLFGSQDPPPFPKILQDLDYEKETLRSNM
jgi:hypothetical protein